MKSIKDFTNDIWENCTNELVDKMISIQDKISIRDKINKLNKNEMLYIFQLILKSNEKYTENQNGVFIDLNTFKYETLIEIITYLDTVFESKNESKVQILIKK